MDKALASFPQIPGSILPAPLCPQAVTEWKDGQPLSNNAIDAPLLEQRLAALETYSAQQQDQLGLRLRERVAADGALLVEPVHRDLLARVF